VSERPYDVAVVGASIAGCTAARLYAQRGARVALIERRPSMDAYKTVCTHFIQSSANGTIERLGLTPLLDEHGALLSNAQVWTPFGGWIRFPEGIERGYSVTRKTLDPLLRRLAADTPGVDLLGGETVVGLLGGGRPAGVETEGSSHERRRLPARLVVAADGRDTRLARMAGVPGRVRPHGRFFYWAYYEGLRLPTGTEAQMWIRDPDGAYAFPMENDLTLILAGPHKRRLPEFRADLEGAYGRYLADLPDGPDLSSATRVSKLIGKLDMPNVARPAARPGIAFVGDAALASDPFWGVGCGWAFQSAEWLVEETADALVDGGDLDGALERYRRRHARQLLPHHVMICDTASGRTANSLERRLFRAAARDPRVAAAFESVGSRREPPWRLLTPPTLARIARVAAAA
jgi:flavin-dependent dehydrogenase